MTWDKAIKIQNLRTMQGIGRGILLGRLMGMGKGKKTIRVGNALLWDAIILRFRWEIGNIQVLQVICIGIIIFEVLVSSFHPC